LNKSNVGVTEVWRLSRGTLSAGTTSALRKKANMCAGDGRIEIIYKKNNPRRQARKEDVDD